MSVNLEVKGSLAKCLATENLIIEHKTVPTASFDVDRRVLTLPRWEKASATVYDLLVGHEVGHALFTDNIDWTKEYPDVPKDFINVIEDVRVERLMKKKYPGLSRTFYSGYNELNEQDFFSTKNENLDKLSFIDRINLYFKIGAFHNIAFSDDENEFLTRISLTETFNEVLELAKEIAEFVKYKRKENVNLSPSNSDNVSGGIPQEGQSSSNETDESQEGSGEESGDEESQGDSDKSEDSDKFGQDQTQPSPQLDSGSNGNGNEASNKDEEVNELESKTSKSFDEKSQSLVDKYAQETFYAELPELFIDKIVIPNSYIHSECENYYNNLKTYQSDSMKEALNKYQEYKKSAEKEVSYLVKEFECKKSADQYARSSTARTGVLDTSKLHTYKFNEDLFKKVSVIPDGKNHGLIFILDWSGSMQDWILDTYKQLLNLIWFCRKVNIPFEVYAFTLSSSAYVGIQPNHPPIFNKVKDVIAPEESFRLMNFFTSTVSNRVLEQQLKNIWIACSAYQLRNGYAPRHIDLSGSPIAESIIALHSLIPAFQQKHKLQKVNAIFLTDGEGYDNPVVVEKTKGSGPSYLGVTKHIRTRIRDRKTGRVYREYMYGDFPKYSKILLETVKDRFPTVNLVNFRITGARDLSYFVRWYSPNADYQKIKTQFLKEQSLIFNDTGYDKFFVISSNSMSQNEDFTVQEGASNAQIKTAFSKLLNKKKTNKKILSSFVEMIA